MEFNFDRENNYKLSDVSKMFFFDLLTNKDIILFVVENNKHVPCLIITRDEYNETSDVFRGIKFKKGFGLLNYIAPKNNCQVTLPIVDIFVDYNIKLELESKRVDLFYSYVLVDNKEMHSIKIDGNNIFRMPYCGEIFEYSTCKDSWVI